MFENFDRPRELHAFSYTTLSCDGRGRRSAVSVTKQGRAYIPYPFSAFSFFGYGTGFSVKGSFRVIHNKLIISEGALCVIMDAKIITARTINASYWAGARCRIYITSTRPRGLYLPVPSQDSYLPLININYLLNRNLLPCFSLLNFLQLVLNLEQPRCINNNY